MKIAVRYHSRTGNTKKVAEAIAEELGLTAEDLSTPLSEKVDALFLGSAVYAAGVDKEVKDFIRDNHDKIGVIYNFSTTAILTSTYKKIKKVAEENGVKIADEEFHCRGKFAVLHGKHPDDEDLQNAKNFASEILKNIEKDNG